MTVLLGYSVHLTCHFYPKNYSISANNLACKFNKILTKITRNLRKKLSQKVKPMLNRWYKINVTIRQYSKKKKKIKKKTTIFYVQYVRALLYKAQKGRYNEEELQSRRGEWEREHREQDHSELCVGVRFSIHIYKRESAFQLLLSCIYIYIQLQVACTDTRGWCEGYSHVYWFCFTHKDTQTRL